MLQNPQEVLTAAQRARLASAAHSDSIVRIITEAESQARGDGGDEDVALSRAARSRRGWAGAPDFRWDATSWKGVLTQAYYEWPKAGAEWAHAAEETQWTIRTYSQLVMPFPYPQATSVAGPVGGMEYPMFVFVNYASQESDPNGVFGTLDHEHGHEWFPMIVGSNERRYAWMDEGFNTYINTFSNEQRFPRNYQWPPYIGQLEAERAHGRAASADDAAGPRAAGALGSDRLSEARARCSWRFAITWSGARRSTRRSATTRRAGRSSIRRRQISSASIESSTGEDLSWFWRGFFYTNDVLDIGIDSASTISRDGQSIAMIQLRRHTSIPFPVEMRLKLADGIDAGREASCRRLVPRRRVHRDDPGARAAGRRAAVARRYRSRLQLVK